jgi:hypothetical protein
MATAA